MLSRRFVLDKTRCAHNLSEINEQQPLFWPLVGALGPILGAVRPHLASSWPLSWRLSGAPSPLLFVLLVHLRCTFGRYLGGSPVHLRVLLRFVGNS